jgi:hypothetical protein
MTKQEERASEYAEMIRHNKERRARLMRDGHWAATKCVKIGETPGEVRMLCDCWRGCSQVYVPPAEERAEERLDAFRAYVDGWDLPVFGVAKRNLDAAGIKTYGDAMRVGPDAVLAVKGVGPITIETIEVSREWQARMLSEMYETVEAVEEAAREGSVTPSRRPQDAACRVEAPRRYTDIPLGGRTGYSGERFAEIPRGSSGGSSGPRR